MATEHLILAVIISIFSKSSKLLSILKERALSHPNFPLLQSLFQVCHSIEEQDWYGILESPAFKSILSHINGNLKGQNENINVIIRILLTSILYQAAPTKLKHQPPSYTLQLPLGTKTGEQGLSQQLEDALKIFEFETFSEPSLMLTLRRDQEATKTKLIPNPEISIEINEGLKHDYELAAVLCKTQDYHCCPLEVYLRRENWIKISIPDAGNIITQDVEHELGQMLRQLKVGDTRDAELPNQEIKHLAEDSIFIVYHPVGEINNVPKTSQLGQICRISPANASSRFGSAKGVEGRLEMSLFSNLLMSLLFVECPASIEFLKQVGQHSSAEISREVTMISTAISKPPYFCREAGAKRVYNLLLEKSPKLAECSNFFVDILLREVLNLPGFLSVVDSGGVVSMSCAHQIVSRPKPMNQQARALLSTALEQSFQFQNCRLTTLPEPFLILKAPRIGNRLVGYESLVPTFRLNLTKIMEQPDTAKESLELYAVICQLGGLNDYISFIRDRTSTRNFFYFDSAKSEVQALPNFEQMVLKESILGFSQMTVHMKRLFRNPFIYVYGKKNSANPSLQRMTVRIEEKQNGLEQLKVLAIQRRQPLKRVVATSRVLVSTMKFECTICSNEIEPGEGVILKSCFHLFCRLCVIRTIQFCDDPKVKCPYYGDETGCSAFVSDVEIRTLLSPEMYQKHIEISLRLAEGALGNKAFHCKTPDCAGWCELEQEARPEDQLLFQCYVCGMENCVACKIQHSDVSCDDYRNRIVQCENEMMSEESIRNAIARGEAMPCPSCGITVFKDGGCDAIICKCCKLDICWATRGRRWGPGGAGDRSGGCGCDPANSRYCTPNCGNCH